MSQGPLCPNLTQKVQKEVSQIAIRNLPVMILLGGLSVKLNHLKRQHSRGMHTVRVSISVATTRCRRVCEAGITI